jgi:hypothetical protein
VEYRNLLAFALGALSACQPSAPSPPPAASAVRQTPSAAPARPATDAPASAEPRPSAAPAASDTRVVDELALDPDVAPSFGEPGPVSVEPQVPGFEHGMMDHATRFGWTADSKEFGYCMVDGGLGSTRCAFLNAAGKLEEARDHVRGNETLDPAKTRLLEARIARHDVREARWRFARDLVVTWESTALKLGATTAKKPVRLRVGARVRGARKASLPLDLRGTGHAETIHPEAILVSPDGRRLAALSHDFGGEFSDHFELRAIDTGELAAQAYNMAGLDLHLRGEFAKAAELFHRATYADPKAKLAPYNLACAFARLGHPKTQRAFELAVARGGPEVVGKAALDGDFESVRTTEWFRKLVR